MNRYPTPVRRFVFDGMSLLPAKGHDTWYVPGHRIADTKELYALAQRQGVSGYIFIRKEETEK
jgi:hypothetical protein